MTNLSKRQLNGPPTQDQDQQEEDALINASLFVHAVMLYARAIAASPNGGRKDPPITTNFTEEQKIASANIIDLRNKGIAHFDKTTKLIDGSYSMETISYRKSINILTGDAEELLDHIFTRYNYKAALVQDLADCIVPALKACEDMKAEHMQALREEIQRLSSKYKDFDDNLNRFILNAGDYGLTGEVGTRHILGPSGPRPQAQSRQT